EDQIPLRVRWSGKERLAEERIDVLPDDLSLLSHFEEAAVGRLADECVAVRQALSVAHAWREEVPGRLVLIFPPDLVRRGIDLDHPRERHRVIQTVSAVVEYQDVAVRQRSRRMMTRNCRSVELPDNFAGRAGDAEQGRGRPVTREKVAVRQLQDTVALRP